MIRRTVLCDPAKSRIVPAWMLSNSRKTFVPGRSEFGIEISLAIASRAKAATNRVLSQTSRDREGASDTNDPHSTCPLPDGRGS